MSKKRRIKMEIVRDVFEILRARGALNKTEIVYGANLNYERASCIINWLIEHELVTVVSGKYMITEKGETFTAVFTTPPRYSLLVSLQLNFWT